VGDLTELEREGTHPRKAELRGEMQKNSRGGGTEKSRVKEKRKESRETIRGAKPGVNNDRANRNRLVPLFSADGKKCKNVMRRKGPGKQTDTAFQTGNNGDGAVKSGPKGTGWGMSANCRKKRNATTYFPRSVRNSGKAERSLPAKKKLKSHEQLKKYPIWEKPEKKQCALKGVCKRKRGNKRKKKKEGGLW